VVELQQPRENPCQDLARGLAYIEKNNCLRYLRIDYGLLEAVCRRYKAYGRDLGLKINEALGSIERSVEICREIQEVGGAAEEAYGSIYLEVKRAIDILESTKRVIDRRARGFLTMMAGLSISLTLLDIALLSGGPEDLLALLITLLAGVFSALNILIALISPIASIALGITSSSLILTGSLLYGGAIEISASIALLIVSIANTLIVIKSLNPIEDLRTRKI
jgi:hypothetical protein